MVLWVSFQVSFTSSDIGGISADLSPLLPYNQYEVTVRCRSNKSDRWSKNSSIPVHTKEDLPEALPVVRICNYRHLTGHISLLDSPYLKGDLMQSDSHKTPIISSCYVLIHLAHVNMWYVMRELVNTSVLVILFKQWASDNKYVKIDKF